VTAADILDHYRSVGTWVDWDRTCDRFLHGDPHVEVRGVVTAWTATNAAIEEAARLGANLFVTHEPAFCDHFAGTPTGDRVAAEKRALLDRHGIVLLRCHDTWDRMPEVGIPDAWATCLGFPAEPRPVESFYRICLTGSATVADVARRVRETVQSLGEDTVRVLGDLGATVERLAIGTGAITFLPAMHGLGADAILATDDGINMWDGGLWGLDLGIPILIVNHATAEKPGMMAMARYLEGICPGVRIAYVDVAFPPRTVR
jgi:putative NIF3 family GTP cyclohydrolase 1 type 2